MCVGIPMRIIEGDECWARCRGRQGEARIDMRLVGAQPEGAWIMAFMDIAREVLTEERAAAVNAALEALASILSGQPVTPEQLDAFFPDLAGRKPELPEFLKNAAADSLPTQGV